MKIGIMGAIGAGKDTVGNMIADKLELDKLRFAAPIKNITRNVFEFDFDDRAHKEVVIPFTDGMKNVAIGACMLEYTTTLQSYMGTKGFYKLLNKAREVLIPLTEVSPRTFQQLVGTEIFRAIDPDVWLQPVLGSEGVVCTDVRFVNEACLFDKIVVVLNPRVAPLATDTHASEQFLKSLLESNHDKYPCKLGELHSSGLVSTHQVFGHTCDLYVIYNAYSMTRLDEIVNTIIADWK